MIQTTVFDPRFAHYSTWRRAGRFRVVLCSAGGGWDENRAWYSIEYRSDRGRICRMTAHGWALWCEDAVEVFGRPQALAVLGLPRRISPRRLPTAKEGRRLIDAAAKVAPPGG